MTIGWPSDSFIFGWSWRKKTSLLPPGAAGLMRRTGLVGKVWAWAVSAQRLSAATIRRVDISSPRILVGGSRPPGRSAAYVTRHPSLGLDPGRARDLDPLRDLFAVELVVLLRRAG